MIHTPDSTPASPYPSSLSDRDSHLFAAFISARFDLTKLATDQHLSPAELLAFTQSAAIRAALDNHRAFAEAAFQARAFQLQASALDLLHEVAQSSTNPVEKRRATTCLVTQLSKVARLPQVARLSEACATSKVPKTSPSQAQPPEHPDSPNTPRFYAAQNHAKPSDDPQDKNKRPPEDAFYEADPPAITPAPELTNTQVAQIATDCLADALNPHKASTAFAFIAPTARLAADAAPKNLIDFANILLYHLAPRGRSTNHTLTPISESPTEFTYKLDLTNSSGYHNRYTLRLTRQQPNTPWLITTLNRQDTS